MAGRLKILVADEGACIDTSGPFSPGGIRETGIQSDPGKRSGVWAGCLVYN